MTTIKRIAASEAYLLIHKLKSLGFTQTSHQPKVSLQRANHLFILTFRKNGWVHIEHYNDAQSL